jgi:hypothetical protein
MISAAFNSKGYPAVEDGSGRGGIFSLSLYPFPDGYRLISLGTGLLAYVIIPGFLVIWDRVLDDMGGANGKA